jgi:hypothetical protein
MGQGTDSMMRAGRWLAVFAYQVSRGIKAHDEVFVAEKNYTTKGPESSQ